MSEERMRILDMISAGTITAEQAALLIAALSESESDDSTSTADSDSAESIDLDVIPAIEETASEDEDNWMFPSEMEEASSTNAGSPWTAPADPPAHSETAGSTESATARESHSSVPPFNRWRAFYIIPLAIGVALTGFSGMLVFAGDRADWHWFWMACVWMPLLFGIFLIVASWMSRTARWLHVRVNTGQEEWPRNIKISLPLPLRTAAFLFRVFGRWIPALDDVPVPVDQLILALQDSLTPDDPLHVQVEDSGGERVEVYIG